MGDWSFWIAAAGMTLAVAASLIATLFQRGGTSLAAGDYDLQVYRAQLADVDRDVASGVLAMPEAERLRVEISRRILEADRLGRGVAVPATRGSRGLAGLVIAVAIVGAVWGYVRLGAPGYADLPLAERLAAAERFRTTRPSQAMAEAATAQPTPVVPDLEMADLMAKLRAAVAARPGDVQGLDLLARNEASFGNLGAARDALVALMAAKSSVEGTDHARLAELLIRLAGGYVSPEAEAELINALKLEPMNGTALYYSGLMFAQGDRADRAFAIWRDLLDASAPDDVWVAPIRAQIADMAARAGEKYVLPEVVGPSAAEVDAAGAMTPEDRLAMIQGMVDGLSTRLASQGGPAEDWARLITSLEVLGNSDQARAIYTEAQSTFAGRDAELAKIREAAVAAGIEE